MDIKKEIRDLNEKGKNLAEEGRFSEAIRFYIQAREIAEQYLEVTDELRLLVLRDLGETYILNGEYMKAQAILENLLSVMRKHPETHNLLLTKTLYSLGHCYLRQSKYVDATSLLEECLLIRQKHLPANDVKVAETMGMLGECFMEQKKLPEAERLLRQSLEIMKSAHTEDHRDLASVQFALSQFLYQQGEVSESIKLMADCVRMFKSTLRHEHPRVANAVGQLGVYLLEVGKLDESEQYLRECLDIYRHSLHEKHPNTALSLKYLGKCLMKKGNNKEAEKLLSEAVNIEAAGLDQNHPEKISTLILWSECLLNIADYTRAQPALFTALRIININQQPSSSRERSEVMHLLRRLSPFQQPQSGETIIGEGKAEEVEQTDERKSWIEDEGDDHPDQSAPTMENLDISDVCHPLWVGGTLEVLHVWSSDGLSFHETIGSEGGELSAGSVSITVPAGAVQSPTQFSIHSFMHDKYMPPVSASGSQVVSPVIFLGPHDVSFGKPIKVCINTIADVTSVGEGSFTLMRCESRLDEMKWRWRGVVVYSPDTQEVQSHIPFDLNSWSVEVTSFSGWLWLVSFIKSPTILFRRKMGCVVLGRSLSACKWSLSVHLFNSYEEIGQKIIRDHQGHVSLPVIQLCPVTEIIVRKQGHVVMKPQLGPEWLLCRGDAEVQLPTRHLWRQSFDHDHCFTFEVEINGPCPDSLVVPVRVEYIRQGEVDFSLTLEAVHKLFISADSSNSSLPSHSPSLPHEEQKAFYFCSEEGLHSSGFTSSSTAARDRTSSQRSIIQQPADVHTVSQCDVSPIYSKVQEKSSLQVRLPVGSEVPCTGCTFRYIDTTGQTIEEVPGERLDSRTIETVTPAWPRADRVEIHIFSSDGQTRLGCFVHVFIDLSAEMLPRIVNHEDDSSIVPGAVSQETDKVETEQQKRLESSAKSKCTDKDMLSVTCKVIACWQEFVSHLSPTFFTMDRIDIIKGDYKKSFAQTKKALDMWTKKFGVKATRRSIITAMCDINRRLQAERIFGCDLVDHVCPSK
ncbi:uncharacterized protein LOC134188950 isoform X2 [Corticium candelabrum]|uniref:uncharacterized protein LOC134188950 isoform X2 n=1 Tax=Corticium candelabrum TaxID=121492 RepID=UPI002E273C2F|nr:uncharacterized protein LOC134188950 isoform X2 [Corticium candelabrum]